MADKPTTPSANPLNPKPQTKAGIAFANWVAERRKLTDEEILDIGAELQGLKAGIAPLDLKPKTEYGIAFVQRVLDYEVLTKEDVSDIEAQLQGLKPVRPPAPPVVPPGTPLPIPEAFFKPFEFPKEKEPEPKPKPENAM